MTGAAAATPDASPLESWPSILLAASDGKAAAEVVLGTSLCPVDLLKVPDSPASDVAAIAASCLVESDAEAGSLLIRHTRQGTRELVAGLRKSTLASVRAVADRHGVRLTAVRPLVSWLSRLHRGPLHGIDGWLAIDEPGALSLGYVADGIFEALHTQRVALDEAADIPLLADRQARIHGLSAGPVSVVSLWRRIDATPGIRQVSVLSAELELAPPRRGRPQ